MINLILTLVSHFHRWEDGSLSIVIILYCLEDRQGNITLCNLGFLDHNQHGVATGTTVSWPHVVRLGHTDGYVPLLSGIAAVQDCATARGIRAPRDGELVLGRFAQGNHLSIK